MRRLVIMGLIGTLALSVAGNVYLLQPTSPSSSLAPGVAARLPVQFHGGERGIVLSTSTHEVSKRVTGPRSEGDVRRVTLMIVDHDEKRTCRLNHGVAVILEMVSKDGSSVLARPTREPKDAALCKRDDVVTFDSALFVKMVERYRLTQTR